MKRVTEKMLILSVDYLNEITGNPVQYYTYGHISIGHYTLSGAYGGWQLQQIMNNGGGVDLPLGHGFYPKRELYNQINAFILGINNKDKKNE